MLGTSFMGDYWESDHTVLPPPPFFLSGCLWINLFHFKGFNGCAGLTYRPCLPDPIIMQDNCSQSKYQVLFAYDDLGAANARRVITVNFTWLISYPISPKSTFSWNRLFLVFLVKAFLCPFHFGVFLLYIFCSGRCSNTLWAYFEWHKNSYITFPKLLSCTKESNLWTFSGLHIAHIRDLQIYYLCYY